MAAVAPMVFQCGSCRRVVSDSNQLLSAVAELDALVLDAVVGVTAEVDEPAFATLRCSACHHKLGRCYQQPPKESLTHLVHRDDAPRYTLSRASLESYVLGSTQAKHTTGGGTSSSTELSSDVALLPIPSERVAALEASEADMRLQLSQLMRVVLALDQRLRSLEVGDGAAGDGLARKRHHADS